MDWKTGKPDKDGRYLVTVKDWEDTQISVFQNGDWYIESTGDIEEVTAWMPIPEPYKPH